MAISEFSAPNYFDSIKDSNPTFFKRKKGKILENENSRRSTWFYVPFKSGWKCMSLFVTF